MLKQIATVALAVIAAGSLMTARADSQQVASSAASTTNNSVAEGIANAGPTVNISSNPAWAAALPGANWISFASTGNPSGPSFYTVPNGESVVFTQVFDLTGGNVTGATLSVLADDTTSVILNGVTLYSANLGGSYPTCSSVAIGCLISTEGVFTFADLAPYLNPDGVNTLQFVVYQEAGSSYGLDYSGTITTPEPSSIMLLAAGMIGLLAISRKFANA
jgi:hypothetical protein